MNFQKKPTAFMAALTFTALIMGVILLAAPQREAQGVMLNAQSGFSLMTTGTPGGDEVLIVVDKSSEKMIIYQLNGNQLQILSGAQFGRWFK